MKNKIRTFIVDDSEFVISSVSKKLKDDPEIEVIGSAHNGKEALDKIRILQPDVITLDVIMPEMDGLAVLQHLMADNPIPVVMLSALTSEGADITIKALELGAVDFFLKPSALRPAGNNEAGNTLVEKVKRAAMSIVRSPSVTTNLTTRVRDKKASLKERYQIADNCPVIVIGSSTGGPGALMQVVPALPMDFRAAILIVQHMPPVFTKSLAERLDQSSQIPVTEACDGNTIAMSRALLAPGDYHMIADKQNRIVLNQDPPVLGVRPSVDITMKSVAEVYGSLSIGVVLTGMGSDGTLGSSCIKTMGGKIIVQDESTSVIYGMPQSIVRAGFADKILPLNKIAHELSQICCVYQPTM